VVRAAAVAALVAGLAAVAVVLLGGGPGSYEVRARFLDAGQLVEGNVVEVAGQRVGKIEELALTGDGRAEVRLRITDERFVPLHRGTRMTIRTVGLSGVANRYIDITPGSGRQPAIASGGVLGTEATQGIVDLDMVLNAFGPAVRKDIRTLLVASAQGLDGNAPSVNRLLEYLNPAVAQGRALVEDVTADQAAVDRLLRSGAVVATALAGRRSDLERGVAGAATALEAVAGERAALGRGLRRAPGVLARGRRTLRGLDATLQAVRPALREARPVAPRLATTLRRFGPVARDARPVVGDLRRLAAPTRGLLGALPGLADDGVPALRSATSALAAAQPVLSGLRPYTLDILHGLIIAPGNATGSYDANGSYSRFLGMSSSPESFGGRRRCCPGSASRR
jgi:phospholipid/cholesterol/gamma-HCH transport system substrate-binding protein